MDRIFSVYAWRGDAPEIDRRVLLELPALPYELRGALDRLRADSGIPLYAQIEEYFHFPFLSKSLYGRQKLCELNGLAQRLAGLNLEEASAFQGLLKMGLPGLLRTYAAGSCLSGDGHSGGQPDSGAASGDVT